MSGRILLIVAIFAAVLAAAMGAAALRDGILIDPDGWAYWQGSVSILDGKGYTYFFSDLPIGEWPPLYSLYLTLWQFGFGVSGSVVRGANLFLTGVTAFGWCFAILTLYREPLVRLSPLRRRVSGVMVLLFTAGFSASQGLFVLSDNLKLALLPWLVYFACRLRTAASTRRVVAVAAAVVGVGCMVVLVHNSAFAFLLAAAMLAATARPLSRAKFAAASAVLLVPTAVWFLVRQALGQAGSHAIGLGVAQFSPSQYCLQLVAGVANQMAFGRTSGVVVLLVILVLYLSALVKPTPEPRVITTPNMRTVCLPLLLFALTALAGLWAMFNIVWISNELAGRFVAFAACLFVPSTIIWTAATFRPAIFIPVTTLFAFLPGVTAVKCIALGAERVLSAERLEYISAARTTHAVVLDPRWVIRRDVILRDPVPDGSRLLVSPPFYRWLAERTGRAR